MKETEQTKIMLVGNDGKLLRLASTQLADADLAVICIPSGEQAVNVLCRERIDLILLDADFLDGDGCPLSKRIRGEEGGFLGPVIFTGSSGGVADIVAAFRSGGDDYLVKPLTASVLAACIKANLERMQNALPKGDRQWFKQFMIDKGRREVYRVENGQLREKIPLSPLEYGVLTALIEHQNEVRLYKDLYRDVWQQEDLGDVRSLMVHVSNLRKKVDAHHTEMIMAVRGAGYLFQDA